MAANKHRYYCFFRLIHYLYRVPVSGKPAKHCSPLHLRFRESSVSCPAGNTGLSGVAPDRPVYPGISPVYVPNSLLLALAAAQPVLMRHHGHQVDEHIIDGGYHGAGDWVSLRRVLI